jgi:hypothetical protein
MNCKHNKFRLMVVHKMFIDNNTNRGGGGVNLSPEQSSTSSPYDNKFLYYVDGQYIWKYPSQRVNNATSSPMIKSDCSVEALMVYLLYLIYLVIIIVIGYWLNAKVIEMRRNRRRMRENSSNNVNGGDGGSSSNEDSNKNTDDDVELASIATAAASAAFSAAGLSSAPTPLPHSPYSQPLVQQQQHRLTNKNFINSLGFGGCDPNSARIL